MQSYIKYSYLMGAMRNSANGGSCLDASKIRSPARVRPAPFSRGSTSMTPRTAQSGIYYKCCQFLDCLPMNVLFPSSMILYRDSQGTLYLFQFSLPFKLSGHHPPIKPIRYYSERELFTQLSLSYRSRRLLF